MAERIANLTTAPRIGWLYQVQCVFCDYAGAGEQWWPILGPLHDDLDYFKIEKSHYHFDARFLTARQMRYLCKGYPCESASLIALCNNWDKGPAEKLRRCYREMPTHPLSIASRWDGRTVHNSGLPAMEKAYKSHRLNVEHPVCPHRGFRLCGLPQTDGVVVCPGHGLAWNLNTGRMVSRLAPAELPAKARGRKKS